jgi:hypothetical protein
MKVSEFWFPANRMTPAVPSGAAGVDRSATKEQIKALRKEILGLLTQRRFVAFEKQPLLYFDNQLNFLWLLYDFQAKPEDMEKYISKLRIHSFRQWEMPRVEQLQSVVPEELFSGVDRFRDSVLLSGSIDRDGQSYLTVRMGDGAVAPSRDAHTIVPVHRVSQRDIFSFIVTHSLVPRDFPAVAARLKDLYALTSQLSQSAQPGTGDRAGAGSISMATLERVLLEGDYNRARLPVLEPSYLVDMGKGLWELFQAEQPRHGQWVRVALEKPWEARDPELDVRNGVVAIDFGTSSTVVACREHGKTTLLRVGMADFFRKPTPEDYQNPTVMAFINLTGLLAAWNTDAYQPLTRWEDFQFSHEALRQLRENEADQQIVSSILTNFKQWPLTSSSGRALRVADQAHGLELEIRPTRSPVPVRGEALTVSEDDPLDPIELYAYYLGLFINHRANGIFLQYYMTFPITYPREAKDQILGAFARGLQRSLPYTLIERPVMQRFFVREEASEPAAYAACALADLQVMPTRDGTAYAVFDFGGGSTDFDFGLFRLPTPEEEMQGYEHVIRHFGASGDMYLGGENLVATMAYLVFRNNLEVCRDHRIPFVCPPEAEKFPGHEPFLDHSNVAYTNMTLLMARVRHIWEDFQWEIAEDAGPVGPRGQRRRLSDRLSDLFNQSIVDAGFNLDPDISSCREGERVAEVSLELLSRNRSKVMVTLQLDRHLLNQFLVQRVGRGILRFFVAMKQAFENRDTYPEEVHILQAGNSSRSILVQSLFTTLLQERMLKWEMPVDGLVKNAALEKIRREVPFQRFVVHRPPVGDPENPYRPTAKTGVAIGLLKLIPGESLLAIGPNEESVSGEAMFRFFIGRFRFDTFIPVIKQNAPYREWCELGIPTRGAFVLAYSTSPQAGLGNLKRGASEIQEKHLAFRKGVEGKRLYVQAVGPNTVEVCLADTVEQIRKRPEEIAHQELVHLELT